MKLIKKDGKNYIQHQGLAIPVSIDKNGKAVIKPIIERTKDKKGKETLIIRVPALQIKLSNNK